MAWTVLFIFFLKWIIFCLWSASFENIATHLSLSLLSHTKMSKTGMDVSEEYSQCSITQIHSYQYLTKFKDKALFIYLKENVSPYLFF